MYSIPPSAREIFDMYLFHQSTSSYHRSELSKKVTAFKRSNKNTRISSGMLVKDRFPTLFAYVNSLYPGVPEEELFENNFKKLITNLYILPSERSRTAFNTGKVSKVYNTLTASTISDAYTKRPAKLYNSITKKTYELTNYVFKSLDGTDSFHASELEFILTSVQEA